MKYTIDLNKLVMLKVVCCAGILTLSTSCTLTDEPLYEFEVHDVGIVNNSASEVFVDFFVINHIPDPDPGKRSYFYDANRDRVDSAYAIAGSQEGRIIRDFILKEQGRLKTADVIDRIISLDIYKISNNDTLRATVDLSDFTNWTYDQREVISNGVSTGNDHHFYHLIIEDSHFD